jgi:hypothetical protein
MKNNKTNKMKISDWLDKKEAENLDVSQIALPEDLSYYEVPDEYISHHHKIICPPGAGLRIPILGN